LISGYANHVLHSCNSICTCSYDLCSTSLRACKTSSSFSPVILISSHVLPIADYQCQCNAVGLNLSNQVLSLSLDDSRTTQDECLGRTQWSSPLDSTIYLYYFYKWLCPIITWSHVLPEYSMITWPCHVMWLLNLPTLFISWLHCMTWYWNLNIQMCGKLFPSQGSHNTKISIHPLYFRGYMIGKLYF